MSRVRKRCLKRDHVWKRFLEAHLPFEFCARWFCDWSRVNPDYPLTDDLKTVLQGTADLKNREAMQKVVPF